MSEELQVHQQIIEVGYNLPEELQVHQHAIEVGYRTHLTLTWTEHSIYCSSIKVERKVDAGDWVQVQSLNPGLEYFYDHDVESGHTYHYRVRAYSNIRGYSIYCKAVEIAL